MRSVVVKYELNKYGRIDRGERRRGRGEGAGGGGGMVALLPAVSLLIECDSQLTKKRVITINAVIAITVQTVGVFHAPRPIPPRSPCLSIAAAEGRDRRDRGLKHLLQFILAWIAWPHQ